MNREILLLREAPRGFYLGDTAQVARDLIGAWLVRLDRGAWYGARIVETEAYLGASDPAAHTWRGRRTKRVEPMYMDGGHVYVFLVYGMHHCANIVTREPGVGEAVLIRAAAGPAGAPPRLLSGPGRFCAALGITRSCSGVDLLAGGPLRLMLPGGPPPEIAVGPRIGVAYAGEAKDWPLRFFQADSPAVSVRRHP
ncbi:MAG: DNA-3-methyladenine glycosylase [Acidobacteriota bacterium]